MQKRELRRIYKQKRLQLSDAEIEILQENIYQQVFNLDVSNCDTIHLFLTLKKFKEIDTLPIINFFRQLNKTIVVSKSNFTDNTLQHFILESDTEIEINNYGIPEPIHAEPIDEKDIDLVFVPLLISDWQQYRVGYGKGFYDRFLQNCKKGVKKIGLNFFKPIPKISDLNAFDIALDTVIHPK